MVGVLLLSLSVCWLENGKIILISQNLVITQNSWFLRWVYVSCYYSNLLQNVLSRAKLNFLSPKCVFQRQNYWVPLLQHFKSIWYVYMSQSESGRYCYTNSEPWCDYMISASYHKIIVIYISKIFGLEKLDYKTSS